MEETIDWRARTTAWELLAYSLRYPDAELVETVASGAWREAASEVPTELGVKLPEEWGSRVATDGQDPVALARALRAEATRLFVGAPKPAVSPYEGVWRAEDEGVRALLFVNPHSMEVERFCKACGLGRPEGTNEPLDHAASECELLEYLAGLEAGVFPPRADLDPDALPGGSPTGAYEAFLDEHALSWMPRFAAKLAAEARHPFYRAVGELMEALLPALASRSRTHGDGGA